MPELAGGVRTRNVKTITDEQQIIPDKETAGLGMPWQDYLATCSEEELAVTTIYVYRKEPLTIAGYLLRSGGGGEPAERIDEQWLDDKVGGGTYDLTIRSKSGKSHYERAVRIAGEPKLTPKEKSSQPGAPTSAAAPAADTAFGRVIDLLEKQNERIERLLDRQTVPASNPGLESALDLVAAGAKKGMEFASAAMGSQPNTSKSGLGEVETILAIMDRIKGKERTFEDDLSRLKLLKEILAPAGTAPGDPVAQVTQLGALIDVVEKIHGGGGKADWKSALVEQIGSAIPSLAEAAKAYIETRPKVAEKELEREKLREKNIATVARMQQPGAAGPAAPAAAPGAPTVSASRPGVQAAPPAAAGGPGPGPLQVVPIHAETVSTAAPAVDTAEPQAAEQISEEAMLEIILKKRVVELIAEGDDPAGVLDFIDRAAPKICAMLTQASEAQIRAFIAADRVLSQAMELPHFERWLKGLLAVLAVEAAEAEPLPKTPIQ